MPDVVLRHRGSGAFSLRVGETFSLAIDPCDADERVDYVLVSRRRPDRWDATLDLLESPEATLVAGRSACQQARRALELGPDDALEMDAWDRVRSDSVRITAIPATAGTDLPGGLGDLGGVGSLGALPRPDQILSFNPFNALLSAFGGGELLPGDQALAWRIELTDGLTVLWLGEAVAGGVEREWLLDVAELGGDPDVVVIEASGQHLGGVVRAVRELSPDTVLLYRGRDPYAEGAPEGLPIQRFVEAIEEDSPQVDVAVLRTGDAWAVEALAEAG